MRVCVQEGSLDLSRCKSLKSNKIKIPFEKRKKYFLDKRSDLHEDIHEKFQYEIARRKSSRNVSHPSSRSLSFQTILK